MPNTFAIIGAGSSGLAAAKNFRAEGFQVDLFEREGDLGGNWNYDTPPARVYRSTHTISSKPGTEFPDFPMPPEFPDYPHHTQILTYLRAYARHFELIPHIRFALGVDRLAPVVEGDPGTGWTLVLADGTSRAYDGVVVANGHHTEPRYPDIQGDSPERPSIPPHTGPPISSPANGSW